MPYLSTYHTSEQEAAALLRPVCASLTELEQRLQHYASRVAMTPVNRDTVLAAHAAVETARQRVEQLWQQAAASTTARAEG